MRADGDTGHRRGPQEPNPRLMQGWSPLRQVHDPGRRAQPCPPPSTPAGPAGHHGARRTSPLHRSLWRTFLPGQRRGLRSYAAAIAAGLAGLAGLVVWSVLATTGRDPLQDRSLTDAAVPSVPVPALDCTTAAAA